MTQRIACLALTLAALVLPPLAATAKDAHTEPTRVSFGDALPDAGDLVLGVFADGEPGRYAVAIDGRSDGDLSRLVEALAFEAEASDTRLVAAPAGSGLDRILLVGLGESGQDKTALEWQEIGGSAVQAAVGAFDTVPPMAFDVPAADAAQLAYGAKLGSYYFDKYITDPERQHSQDAVSILTGDADAAESEFVAGLDPVANAQFLARDISNEPANVIYPESFVARWRAHFKGLDNVRIRVYDEKDMLKKNMGGIYGVGRGSERPPRMMVVEYMAGEKDAAPVVIVGKGITFDTGGISIKGWNNLWNMKFDMSGAASAMATLHALAARGAKVNAVAIAGLAENMPDGNAQRPGDIVTTLSGKTIEVRHTDAEGRLVLADALHYGDITYDPALLVDLATLTGAAMRALGPDYAALFTRHEELVDGFIETGKQTGDEVWYMPLNDNHVKTIESTVADVNNLPSLGPGASTGAAFLGTFVRDTTPWVHLDIAPVAWSDKAEPLRASPGSTSFAVALLNAYIAANFEAP